MVFRDLSMNEVEGLHWSWKSHTVWCIGNALSINLVNLRTPVKQNTFTSAYLNLMHSIVLNISNHSENDYRPSRGCKAQNYYIWWWFHSLFSLSHSKPTSHQAHILSYYSFDPDIFCTTYFIASLACIYCIVLFQSVLSFDMYHGTSLSKYFHH